MTSKRSSIGLRSALAILAVTLIEASTWAAPREKVLYSFGRQGGDGLYSVIFDASGNFYGTTYFGGAFNAGTVFEVMHKASGGWTEKNLFDFSDGAEGAYPSAGLTVDVAGNLYGPTYAGGAHGVGTVFELSKTRKESLRYSFAGGTDGCYPFGALLVDKADNLYGTTLNCGTSGYGTVFKLSKSGKETVLHSFAGGSSDGEYPFSTSLLMDKNGNLYGVTKQGGSSNEGVVYKLSTGGKLTVLHSFAGGTRDGCIPYGTLAMDKQGNLYGTTTGCGSSSDGIVWRVSNKGAEIVLHNFTGNASDGAGPLAGVVMDAKGNLYGTTFTGGAYNYGTVFEVTPKAGGSWTEQVLHSFGNGHDGVSPQAGLIFDASGNIYGTTYAGGTYGGGTVFEVTP
ncbi:MAG TPA: choice-of-anchor tandem repeat GloVer-containing protein [Terriglobales bacterium]|nr:choice-of-anchor tandem repeat GloVer-containing protein [Terriglobales bacterium]